MSKVKNRENGSEKLSLNGQQREISLGKSNGMEKITQNAKILYCVREWDIAKNELTSMVVSGVRIICWLEQRESSQIVPSKKDGNFWHWLYLPIP